MERQLYPLLATTKTGEGSVLLQNHLGEFGLEKLLANPVVEPVATPLPDATAQPSIVPVTPALPNSAASSMPGEGVVVSARQLVQVFSGLSFDEFSCARIIPNQLGKSTANEGILLFTTKEGSPRAKGGAMEFEFSNGKINRIAFQLSTFRDLEQDVVEHTESGGCRIDPSFVNKLH